MITKFNEAYFLIFGVVLIEIKYVKHCLARRVVAENIQRLSRFCKFGPETSHREKKPQVTFDDGYPSAVTPITRLALLILIGTQLYNI